MSENRLTLIFGKSGEGKTTLAKKLVKGSKRVIVIDTLGEWGSKFGYDTLIQPIQLIDYLITHKTYKLAFYPKNQTDFNFACEVFFALRSIDLVIEEIDFWAKSSYIPDELSWLVRYGRHRNIRLIGIVRRSMSMPILIRSQARYIYTFKQTEPQDLEYMGLFYPYPERIKNLPPHQYILIEE